MWSVRLNESGSYVRVANSFFKCFYFVFLVLTSVQAVAQSTGVSASVESATAVSEGSLSESNVSVSVSPVSESSALKSSALESAVSGSSASVSTSLSGGASKSTPPATLPPFSTSSILQMLFGLGLVIALIFFLAWFLKRIGGVGGLAQSGLRVVATLPLSTRERIVLVQAGDKQLLLGVAPGRVNLLETFDEPVIDSTSVSGNQFSNRLKEAMAKRQKQPQKVAGSGAAIPEGVGDISSSGLANEGRSIRSESRDKRL